MHGHCMQLRFTVINDEDGSGNGEDGSGDAEDGRGKEEDGGKRPDLIMTNKWFIESCQGTPRPTAFLAERCKYSLFSNTTKFL